jgi:hypothetical protein
MTISVRRGGGGGGEVELGDELETIAAITPTDDDLIQRKAGAWVNRTPEQVKADLDIAEYTPDADITAIGNLTPSDDDLIQRKAGAWTNRTPEQVKADLGIVDATPSPFTLDAGSTVIVPVDVADSWVVGANQIDRDAGVGTAEDNRVLFNKTKGAFRAGTTTGTQWNAASQGDHSFATGSNTTAAGARAFAQGTSTSAAGESSHAEGHGTTASGTFSHAEGISTIANASSAHVEGSASAATGAVSHAEGNGSAATGPVSHAEGNSTTASGTNSHSEGSTTTASGTNSHAEGVSTLASGYASHAQGAACTASGAYSHASGSFALASRSSQHSLGASQFGTRGDAQCNRFAGMAMTTDAAPSLVRFNSDPLALTGEMTNVLTIPVNRAHQFRVSVVARRHDVSGDTAGWVFEGLLARGSSGNAAFVGTVDARAWGSAGAAAWDVTLTINTTDATNNYLAITATGEAAKTIRWVATIETTEVG